MASPARPRFVLASASPARRQLLRAAGIDAEVLVSGVDESAVDAPEARALCTELARRKATAVAGRLDAVPRPGAADPTAGDAGGTTPAALVLGCDSVLEFDGDILGKPADPADATARWRRMRGRSGVLHTGHCLIALPEGRSVAAASATTVHFAPVTDAEIDRYVASGEPQHVAGAFTLDGLGAPFVDRIEGDHGTVIGLSLPLLRRLLAEVGVSITDLWAAGPADDRG
ncbi:MAG TPA: nucleoside triphosphate pyrophosphatase [Pilimelia sp.]|nr:nucleoside triphosphate pyrophosphatase [Pilimelia sp.]